MLHRFLLIAVFGTALVLGIQAPNFVDQYRARIDAHYREVVENLRGFQEIADRFHGGDIHTLIRHHQASPDSTFRGEAEPIGRMVARKERFGKEKAAMEAAYPVRAMHIVFLGDREILDETYSGYSRTLRLDKQALVTGVGLALAACILLELLLGVGKRVLGLDRRSGQGV